MRRGKFVASAAIGLLLVAVHSLELGSGPATIEIMRRADLSLNRIHSRLLTDLEQHLIRGSSGHDLFSFLDSLGTHAAGNPSIMIRGPLGEHGACIGEDAELCEAPAVEGSWISTGKRGSYLKKAGRVGELDIITVLPVLVMAGVDTVLQYESSISASGFLLQPDRGRGNGIVLGIIGAFLILLLIEQFRTGRRGFSALLIIGARAAFLLSNPEGEFFSVTLFASDCPLLGSPGDIFLSSISVLLLCMLFPVRLEKYQGAREVWSGLWLACSSIVLSYGVVALPVFVADRSTFPALPIGELLLKCGVLALIGSFAVLFAAAGRIVSMTQGPRKRFSILIGLLLCLSSFWFGSQVMVAGLLVLSSVVWTSESFWAVSKATLLALLGSIFLVGTLHAQFETIRQKKAVELASQLASSNEPWFRLLVEESLSGKGREFRNLHEFWTDSPLSDLPVIGEMVLLDSMGCVVERLCFGLRDRPLFSPPVLPRKHTVITWVDVLEDAATPLSLMNGLAPAGGNGGGFVMVTLIADMISPVTMRGIMKLADGSSWPSTIDFVDKGLISGVDPAVSGLGWGRREDADEISFGFQREFADGPHLVRLVVHTDSISERAAAFLALTGMLCLAAQLGVGISAVWMATSVSSLFYRHRDRLLPFLLFVGAGPLVALLLIGPFLEQQLRERRSAMQDKAVVEEVASMLRESTIRRARDLSQYVTHDGGVSEHSSCSRERILLFGSDGTAATEGEVLSEGISTALVMTVLERGKSIFKVTDCGRSVIALVPAETGVLAVERPLDMAIVDAMGTNTRYSFGLWRRGRLSASLLASPCGPVPTVLPAIATKLVDGSDPLELRAMEWTFRAVSDDLIDVALILGVRPQVKAGTHSAWGSTEIWVLGIFLPLLALTVMLSAVGSRFVSRPVSMLTSLARRVGERKFSEKWPVLPGELKELGLALETMTTSLVQSRLDVERRKAYLEAVLGQITSSVLVVDVDGFIELHNKAALPLLDRLTGHREDQKASVLGGPIEEVLTAVLHRGGHLQQVLSMDEDGAKRLWQVGAAPMYHADQDKPFAAVVVLEEITELAERQRLLAWAELAREVAHEIKNPLTPIKLAAQHLRRAYSEGRSDYQAVLTKATGMIERQALRMEEIVKEFSSFSRASGREFELIDFCQLVDECVDDYRYVEGHDILVKFHCNEPCPTVLGDREALQRVVTNLLDNAIRAIGASGSVNVCVTGEGDRVILICEDTGIGIPDELLERVFEPGFTSRKGGTGLGLPICKSLVDAHGGRIEIMLAESGGTRVVIEFPRGQI